MLKENSYSQNISVKSESLILNHYEHKESNKKREIKEKMKNIEWLTEINHNIVEFKTLCNDIKANVDNLIVSTLTNKLNEMQNTKLMEDEQNKTELRQEISIETEY